MIQTTRSLVEVIHDLARYAEVPMPKLVVYVHEPVPHGSLLVLDSATFQTIRRTETFEDEIHIRAREIVPPFVAGCGLSLEVCS